MSRDLLGIFSRFFFTNWKVFSIRISFSDSSRDVAMATNFVAALMALAFRYLNVRINSVNDASISYKNFVNFGPVTREKTGFICELLYDMAENWRI